VVEVVDDGAEEGLEELEVEQEAGGVELGAGEGDEDAVVVAVRVLALAVVVAEVVAGGEAGFYGDLEHGGRFPSLLIVLRWGRSGVACGGGLRCGLLRCGVRLVRRGWRGHRRAQMSAMRRRTRPMVRQRDCVAGRAGLLGDVGVRDAAGDEREGGKRGGEDEEVAGPLTGLAVVAFILLTERMGMRLYPVGGAPWRRLLFPVAGSLGIGYLLYRFFPGARGSGVPQTKAALFARDGRITLRTVLGKFLCTSVTLASGIPLGREGPSVQVGAGIGSVLGRLLGLPTEQVKKLIPVGAAAAIAAAFNTPLAAVVFSLEEIMGDLNAPMMGGVVLASATAWMVLRISLGNNPLFKVPQYQLVSPQEFAVYAVLGVAGGVVSAAFARLLLGMRARFLRFPQKTVWFQPVAGGLLVGLVGWFVPQVLGVGYGFVGDALNGRMAFRLMLLLLVLKLITVTTSYASGNAGGIFGPALFLGAMVGGSVGTVAHHFFPAYTATPGAYALVGMGAVFAGVVRAPMTSVLMIFEMTQDYAVIVPLMIANLVSLFVASRLQHEPIYEALAVQDGIHMPTRHALLGTAQGGEHHEEREPGAAGGDDGA
jgi:CIC family chloride channel protein